VEAQDLGLAVCGLAVQGRAGQGRAGQGRAGQGRAGPAVQGRSGRDVTFGVTGLKYQMECDIFGDLRCRLAQSEKGGSEN